MYEYIHICIITYNHAYVHVHVQIHVFVCMYVFMFGCMNACVMSIPDYGSTVMHNFCALSLSLFVSACFLFASAILLKVSKGKQSKGKERDGMRSSVFSMLYVLLGTCLCNVLVQIM